MTQVVFLDAGPLGLVSNPGYSPQNHACAQWLQAILSAGLRVIIPEIADYEIRRELLRAGKTRGIAKLDALAHWLEYLPITTRYAACGGTLGAGASTGPTGGFRRGA